MFTRVFLLAFVFFVCLSTSEAQTEYHEIDERLVLDGSLSEKDMRDLSRQIEQRFDPKSLNKYVRGLASIAYYRSFFVNLDSAQIFVDSIYSIVPHIDDCHTKILLLTCELYTSLAYSKKNVFDSLSMEGDQILHCVENKNIAYRFIRTKRAGQRLLNGVDKNDILAYHNEVDEIIDEFNPESKMMYYMDLATNSRAAGELDLSIENAFKAIEESRLNGINSRREVFIFRLLGESFSEISEFRKASENFTYAAEIALKYQLQNSAELNKALASEASLFAKNYKGVQLETPDSFATELIGKTFLLSALYGSKKQSNGFLFNEIYNRLSESYFSDTLKLKPLSQLIMFDIGESQGLNFNELKSLYHHLDNRREIGWKQIVLDSIINYGTKKQMFEEVHEFQKIKIDGLVRNESIRNRTDIIHRSYELTLNDIDRQLESKVNDLAEERRRRWIITGFLILSSMLLLNVWRLRQSEKRRNRQLNKLNAIITDRETQLTEYIDERLQLENFAFLASHDLKSPLQNVINFSKLLNKSASEKLSDNEKKYLDYITQGSDRMRNTIEDLLKFSLAKNKELDLESFELRTIFNELESDLASIIDNLNAEFIYSLNESVVYGDKSLIKQLFQNLFTNALKFIQQGTRPKIEIRNFLENNRVYFEIKDNGIGIEENSQKNIFGIFKRLHLKEEFDGTGIGLAICKLIVDKHNGKIDVKSALGKGSTFYFSLPQKELYGEV